MHRLRRGLPHPYARRVHGRGQAPSPAASRRQLRGSRYIALPASQTQKYSAERHPQEREFGMVFHRAGTARGQPHDESANRPNIQRVEKKKTSQRISATRALFITQVQRTNEAISFWNVAAVSSDQQRVVSKGEKEAMVDGEHPGHYYYDISRPIVTNAQQQ